MANSIKILMVESDQDQVYSLKEALTVSQIVSVEIQEVEDGEQALAYLNQEHPFFDMPRPHLMFLGLKLPGMSGLDVLEEIHKQRALRSLPIVVLTNTTNPRVISRVQQPPLPRYVFKKPTTCNEWICVLRCIEDVWLTIKSIPGQRTF